MAYYTMVTLLIAWGFLALFALLGGIACWYAVAAVYDRVEEYLEPLFSLVARAYEELQPVWEQVRERVHAVAERPVFRQLRRS